MNRTAFEMTEADLAELLAAMKPEPVMFLSGGMPMHSSQQERANAAWARLGKKMGFDAMSVLPDRRGNRYFTAIATAPEDAAVAK
jgi:hypothetical protein